MFITFFVKKFDIDFISKFVIAYFKVSDNILM